MNLFKKPKDILHKKSFLSNRDKTLELISNPISLKDIIVSSLKSAGGSIEVYLDDELMAKFDSAFTPVIFSHSFNDPLDINKIVVKTSGISAIIFLAYYSRPNWRHTDGK